MALNQKAAVCIGVINVIAADPHFKQAVHRCFADLFNFGQCGQALDQIFANSRFLGLCRNTGRQCQGEAEQGRVQGAITSLNSLVGVVGPNGCGKSNIIDAVRWVLGESRASELRGESMQDVIFNGTNLRKPASRASVELVFDNSDHRAGGQWGQFGCVAL